MRKVLILTLALLLTVGLGTVALAENVAENVFEGVGDIDVNIDQVGGDDVSFSNVVALGDGDSVVNIDQRGDDGVLFLNEIDVDKDVGDSTVNIDQVAGDNATFRNLIEHYLESPGAGRVSVYQDAGDDVFFINRVTADSWRTSINPITQLAGEDATFVNELDAHRVVGVTQEATDGALMINKIRAKYDIDLVQKILTDYADFVNETKVSGEDVKVDNFASEFWSEGTRMISFGQRVKVPAAPFGWYDTSIKQYFENIVGSGHPDDFLQQEVFTELDAGGGIDMWSGTGTFYLDLFLDTSDTAYLPDWTQHGYISQDLDEGVSLSQKGTALGGTGQVIQEGQMDDGAFQPDAEAIFDLDEDEWLDFEQGFFYSG